MGLSIHLVANSYRAVESYKRSHTPVAAPGRPLHRASPCIGQCTACRPGVHDPQQTALSCTNMKLLCWRFSESTRPTLHGAESVVMLIADSAIKHLSANMVVVLTKVDAQLFLYFQTLSWFVHRALQNDFWWTALGQWTVTEAWVTRWWMAIRSWAAVLTGPPPRGCFEFVKAMNLVLGPSLK